jgi:hypothetical protein
MRLLKPQLSKTYPTMHTVIATVMGVPAEDRVAVGEQLSIAFKGGGRSRKNASIGVLVSQRTNST